MNSHSTKFNAMVKASYILLILSPFVGDGLLAARSVDDREGWFINLFVMLLYLLVWLAVGIALGLVAWLLKKKKSTTGFTVIRVLASLSNLSGIIVFVTWGLA